MEISDEVEINVISILNGQNLIVMGGNYEIGYIISKNIGEILADLATSIGYKPGDQVPCKIYIPRKRLNSS